MSRSDYEYLRFIESGIRVGEEIFVFRVFDPRYGRWEKRVTNLGLHSNKPDVLNKKFSTRLLPIVNEAAESKKQADLIRIQDENIEIQLSFEIVRPKLNLIVFGAGHVGQSVTLMGAMLGYDVMLVDDRVEFATRKRVPDLRVKLFVGDYSDVFSKLKIESNSAVVIVTRGHQYDEVCLRNVIRSKAGYVGMIGSKRRAASVINRLKNDGYSDVDFTRVHAPIGLGIGAKSPQEISVAILAQIINHFNKRKE